MDVSEQLLGGVISIVLLLVGHYTTSARKNKNRFSQIERVIFGEEETEFPGLIKDVSILKGSKETSEDDIRDLQVAIDGCKKDLSSAKKSQEKILEEFGDILNKFEKTITKEIPATIRENFAKEIASMWIQINLKVNKELFESEISHYMTQISDLGGRINSIITTKVNQQ